MQIDCKINYTFSIGQINKNLVNSNINIPKRQFERTKYLDIYHQCIIVKLRVLM